MPTHDACGGDSHGKPPVVEVNALIDLGSGGCAVCCPQEKMTTSRHCLQHILYDTAESCIEVGVEERNKRARWAQYFVPNVEEMHMEAKGMQQNV